MNILHILDEPYDSGIVHYALTAARGLKERGHAVHVWGRAGCYPLKEAARLGLETGSLPGLLSVFAARRRLRGLAVDVVNAHTGSAHAWATAVSRGLSPAPAIVRTRGDARPARRTPAGGTLWARTDGFIAANRQILRGFLEAYPGMKERARCIYQGLANPGEPSSEPSEPVRIGLLGRLDPVKGHACFLKAAALAAVDAPTLRFAVAGREENVKRSQLEELAAELGISRRIEFLGRVPDAGAFMRGCHAGVVASIGSEAVSRAALEWMAAGRPLVATDVGCLPELVIDGRTGFLVKPSEPAALAARLSSLARDAVLRRSMGASARERFQTAFSLKRFIDETEDAYETALRGVPSR